MAKRQYTGVYTRLNHRPVTSQTSPSTPKDLRSAASAVSRYIWTAYSMLNGSYLALATVFAIVLLSFIVPDISQKIHATSELNSMKKALNVISEEVGRAEVACLTAADEVCYLHCTMRDGATETPLGTPEDDTICSGYSLRSTRSEPMQVENDIRFFRQRFFPKRASHREIAITSYVYTDSFNAKKALNLSDTIDDILPSTDSA